MDKLSIEQLEHGRKRTLHNAEELVTDARILLGNERYARCYFLSEIAVEELGKYVMLVAATLNVLVGQRRRKRTISPRCKLCTRTSTRRYF